MVEEITQSHNIAPFEVGKKPSVKNQDSGFGNFLKEAQNEFSAKEEKTRGVKDSHKVSKKEEATNNTLAKGSDSKDTKKTKSNAISEEAEDKKVKGARKINTKDEGDEKISEDSLAPYKLANAKNITQGVTSSVLSQALNQQNSTAQNQSEKTNKESKNALPQDSKELSTAKTNLATSKNPKTLEDVRHLAQTNGLNPSKVEALQDDSKASTQSKAQGDAQDEIPESAKYKVQYKTDGEERVAIINRGTQKPQNITSKISSIYETIKVDTPMPTLSSLFGLKDLP